MAAGGANEGEKTHRYTTPCGLVVSYTDTPLPDGGASAVSDLAADLDSHQGCLLASTYEYPGRYTRFDLGFSRPPLRLTSLGDMFSFDALNERGLVLLAAIHRCLDTMVADAGGVRAVEFEVVGDAARKATGAAGEACPALSTLTAPWDAGKFYAAPAGEAEPLGTVRGRIIPAPEGAVFTEEERSRRPSVFSVLRHLMACLSHPDAPPAASFGINGAPSSAGAAPPAGSASGSGPSGGDAGADADSAGADAGDGLLGLYGAFSYDLAFQFESVPLAMERDGTHRDTVLYLPDSVVRVDHGRGGAVRREYEFSIGAASTAGLPRASAARPFDPAAAAAADGDLAARSASQLPRGGYCDHAVGEYAKLVGEAREKFRVGDMFEVVPGQVFSLPNRCAPSRLFAQLKVRNPSPYGFLFNLGGAEYLVGASPEMYVRVERGGRVETCPISGTIRRGKDAFGDEANIRELLNSRKEESELSMCTDVDRNDKSRVCRAGTVRVVGRRLIEKYSRLIHTVDHVQGYLRPGFDAIDAFMTHMWAVTVTGAPKARAMAFIENNEKSPRRWYAGAVGFLGFDGTLNTGLTLRTIRIAGGVAEVRAGATLLYDSDPAAEEAETRLKASAFLDLLRDEANNSGADEAAKAAAAEAAASAAAAKSAAAAAAQSEDGPVTTADGRAPRILLVDFDDSFVHTLANYLRQTGAIVDTLRHGFPVAAIDARRPDMVVLSPGPGCPSDFKTTELIAALLERNLPVFGVCLGLQAIVEHFGGSLSVLGYPIHGKPAPMAITDAGRASTFRGLGDRVRIGRYHSLYADRSSFPHDDLEVTAVLAAAEPGDGEGADAGPAEPVGEADGVIMGIKHRSFPISAVQFHPESILTESGAGLRMLKNALRDALARRSAVRPRE